MMEMKHWYHYRGENNQQQFQEVDTNLDTKSDTKSQPRGYRYHKKCKIHRENAGFMCVAGSHEAHVMFFCRVGVI